MLIPTGVPEQAKAKISRDVKSGEENFSISNALPHGKLLIKFSALLTRFFNFTDSYLFTIETNPSNSALTLRGSK